MIHSQGNVAVVEDMLWETIIADGHPLHILVISLPTCCSPELNPKELVFHILAFRIRSFRYRTALIPDCQSL
jgi:hypothetical protein